MANAILWSTQWSFDPMLLLALAATAWIYLRGFNQVRHQIPHHFSPWRRNTFLAGLLLLFITLASPLDGAADILLLAHMVQHWLLMMVIPPLIWLGRPTVPLLRGLPKHALARGLGPLLSSPALGKIVRWLTHPAAAFGIWVLVTLAWHWPYAYEAALSSRSWHDFEHLSFLTSSLLLWYRILEPWPTRHPVGFPSRLLLIAAAGLFNSAFSAGFSFSTEPFYKLYEEIPNPFLISPIRDQNAAGAFMWVAGSLPMVAAAIGVALSGLSPDRRKWARPEVRPKQIAPSRFPLRSARLLRSKSFRRSLQWTLAVISGLVLLDGFFGSQIPSSENLAGVLPWTYWRALSLFALLALGNLFCAVCPFTLSRNLAGRIWGRPFLWPRRLQNKWLAAALFVFYLWSYEILELWNRPIATAIWISSFFLFCFLIEGLFPRGTFCRYICPIGQFQFIHSALSPNEVQSLSEEICAQCTTHDCLRGNSQDPGCPTGLFLPVKTGNLDCTFCLDCVRACPHDNAAIVGVTPGRSLGQGRTQRVRSSLDVAVLSILLVWGAFVNAMMMLEPVIEGQIALSKWLGWQDPKWVLQLALLGSLIVIPLFVLPLCAACARWLSRSPLSLAESVRRFVPALVPLGFAMWLAHFSFHLLTGLFSIIPASQRFLHDFLPDFFNRPPMAAQNSFLGATELELFIIAVGLAVSVAVLWRVARETLPNPSNAVKLVLPWSGLAISLYVLGVFIILSPMQMRGMLM